MKKYALYVLMLCFTCPVFGQGSLLYQITGGNTGQTSYLFGTLHMQNESLFGWNNRVYEAIDACDIAAFELDLRLDFDFDKIISKKLKKEWERFFKNDFLPALEAAVPADTLVAKILRFYEPIMANGLKTQMDSMNRKDFVDAYLQNYAIKQGKKIMGIETLKEQIDVVKSIDKNYLKIELIKLLQSHDWASAYIKMIGQGEDLVSNYAKMDYDKVCDLVTQKFSGPSYEAYAKFYYALFDARNEIMFNRTSKAMKKKSLFIAVGTGHLCGEQGLIEKYRRAGYTVTPVDIITPTAKRQLTWKPYTTGYFTTEVPSDVDSVYNEDEDPWAFLLSGSMVRTTYTTTGMLTFKITEIQEDNYFLSEPESDDLESIEDEVDAPIETSMDYEQYDDLSPDTTAWEGNEGLDTISEEGVDVPDYSWDQAPDPDESIDNLSYWSRVEKQVKSEIMPLMMKTMSGFNSSAHDTVFITIGDSICTLITTRQMGLDEITCTIPSVYREGVLEHSGWVLKISGDPVILQSQEIMRFFTSFKRL